MIVFDDVLLIAEASKRFQPNSKLIVRHLFPLVLLSVRDLISQKEYISAR
jgi:hypothetical protein